MSIAFVCFGKILFLTTPLAVELCAWMVVRGWLRVPHFLQDVSDVDRILRIDVQGASLSFC